MDQQPESNTAKYVVAIIIIALIIIGISLSARNKQKPSQDESVTNETATLNDTGATDSEPAINPTITEIDYTIENGFTPDDITIKIGDTVKFVNKSTAEMWVASAMHPDHIVYDGTTLAQHCPDTAGVAFDQCQVGAEYSFTFTKAGTWGYHNHQNAKMYGKVNVTE